MNKTLAIILIIVAFAVGAIGGGWAVGHFYNHASLRLAYLTGSADAGMDVSVLNQLQADNITNAVRLLNSHLDGTLMDLWFFQTDATQSDRKIAQKILQNAKAYRIKYPYKSGSPEIDQTVSNALSLADVPAKK